MSPLFLITSSDSPVTIASLTLTQPSASMASALSWLPAVNIHTSPLTSVTESTSDTALSLITLVLGALTTVSLSNTILAFISCTIPSIVLSNIIGKKVILIYDLTRIKSAANTANTKLKYVNTFPAIICPIVLD